MVIVSTHLLAPLPGETVQDHDRMEWSTVGQIEVQTGGNAWVADCTQAYSQIKGRPKRWLIIGYFIL